MVEPIKIIADILARQMSLSQERIFIYNDGRALPNDSNLYLVLEIQSRPPYGMKRDYKETSTGYIEKLSMNVAERIIVSCISKNAEARKVAYQIQMAINSTYSQQMQEKYKFHIGKIAPVTDNSALEATSRLNRFDVEINLLCAYVQENNVDYYNIFDWENKFEP